MKMEDNKGISPLLMYAPSLLQTNVYVGLNIKTIYNTDLRGICLYFLPFTCKKKNHSSFCISKKIFS